MKKTVYSNAESLLNNLRRNQSMIADHYNHFADICAGDQLREDVINLLQEEHNLSGILMTQLQERGLVSNEMASKENIEAVKREVTIRKKQ